jgi:feruloyl esterase
MTPQKTLGNLICCLLLFSSAYAQNKLLNLHSKASNPGSLNFFFQDVSSSIKKQNKKPLLVVLHGCSQNAESIALQSGWSKLAEANDFYVLYPQQKIFNNPNLCFNWFSTNDISKEQGEASSIKAMIMHLTDSLPIDEERIYIYGVSAGAAMSVALLALYPELFKSGAAIAGTPFGSANDFIEALKIMIDGIEKSPEEWAKLVKEEHGSKQLNYPKLIVLHGTKDMVVNISNSYELIKQWTALHQIDTIPDEIKNNYEGNSNVQKIGYKNKYNETIITFYKVKQLGHALAIDPGNKARQGGETGFFATDIDFFSTWYIARDFGLVK